MLEHLNILCVAATQGPTQSIKTLLDNLQKLNCQVHVEAVLSIGLEALSTGSFDLVLLDLEVPDSGGVQGLERLRAVNARIPVVVLADEQKTGPATCTACREAHGVIFKKGLNGTRLAHVICLAVERGRSEQDLAYRAGKYEDIIENMQDSYYETAISTGRLIIANKTCCRHLGRTHEQCIGLHSKDYVAPEIYRQNIDRHLEIMKTGIGGKMWNVPIIRPDGSRLTVEVRVSLLRDDQGKPVGFGGISRDVTEYLETQNALKASKEKYEEILENLEDRYFELDLKGNLTFMNRAYEGGYGSYTEEEMMAMSFRDYTDDETAKMLYETYNRVYRTGKPCKSLQYLVRTKDGSIFYMEASIGLMRDDSGRPVGFRGVGRDISARKAAELELLQAKERAEAATRAKSEFLANMSHEIRTPMNGILGMYTLLENTPLSPEQVDFVQTGKYSAENLLVVLNDLLDYSKIEAGKLEIECIDFDLRKTLDDFISVTAHRAQSKGLELAFKVDGKVPSRLKGDPDRLRQVMMNLITNAVKFTDSGEVALFVNLEQESEVAVTLRFVVKDTGIGISKADQARLFNSFEQADSSTTRRYGGTGLGLAIVQRLVGLMGGTLGVESEQGQGSTFWFSIPLEKGRTAPRPAMMLPDRIKEKRILIVDDHKTNLDILEAYLKEWGCTCDRAAGAVLALTMMKAMARADAPYHLVISDMLMPGMDGAELGRRIKADEALKASKLIMLTSQVKGGDAAEMKNIGYAAYITKPVRPEVLFDCLVTVFSNGETPSAEKKPGAIITNQSLLAARRCKVRILLAEDNVVNQKLALYLLARFGFTIDAVQNGQQALAALAHTDYDLVLMDVNMPTMDGLTASRIIRDPQSTVLRHDVPIIAMTAFATREDRDHCLKAGMNDHIAKPLDPDLLLRMVEKTVGEEKAA